MRISLAPDEICEASAFCCDLADLYPSHFPAVPDAMRRDITQFFAWECGCSLSLARMRLSYAPAMRWQCVLVDTEALGIPTELCARIVWTVHAIAYGIAILLARSSSSWTAFLRQLHLQ